MDDIKLGGVTDFKRASLGQTVETNLCDFFNWGVVRAGGFVDVQAGEFSPISREGRSDYTTWTSGNPFWAHERDSSLPTEPIRPTGVTINDTFYDTTTTVGDYQHSFDYRLGLITFPTPLLTSSRVTAPYSYRLAPFVRATEPWFNRVYLDGWAYEQDTQKDSADILLEYGLKTPIIVVQYVGERRSKGMQLGHFATITNCTVLFHVLSSDPDEQKRLSEIVTSQAGRTIPMYDLNLRVDSDDFEFDYKNSLRPGKSTYLDCINNYRYGNFQVVKTNSILQDPRRSLYIGTCQVDGEIYRFDI